MGTIKRHEGKRGVVWRVREELPRDPLTGARKWQWVTGPTKRAVQEEVTAIRHRIATGTQITANRLTLGDYLIQWLRANHADVRGSTWERNERDVRLHLIPTLGALKLADVTPLHIQALYDRLNTRLAPASVRRVHAVLAASLDQAVAWQLMLRNPAKGVVLPRDAHREMQVWDEREVATFLTATHAHPYAALWRLAVLVGLRRGELLALQWDDLDTARATLTVRRTLTVDDQRRLIVGTPKTRKGSRTLTLPASCVTALHAHRRQQNSERLRIGSAWQDKNLVFPASDGDLLWPSYPGHWLDTIAKHAKLPRLRFHDLRHTAATLALLQGISPRVVQERLGHASLEMTLGLYSHVTLTMQTDAAAKMDAMFADLPARLTSM
jgi:integrase